MSYRPRFRKGPHYRSVAGLVRAVLAGRWVYLYGRPQHPSWLASMSITTLRFHVRRRDVRVAIDTDPGRPSRPWSSQRRVTGPAPWNRSKRDADR